ncbi:MAG: formate dehydrogenase subunit alpha [Planctomycetes bacterium]|nr:formate dehydrogenase subunit alpha [Planctomycetota bacterium]
MADIKVTINGKNVTGKTGQTILELAKENKIKIPHLCNDRRIKPVGACRMCLVDVEGQRNPVTACTFEITPDMVIQTDTDEIRQLRKTVLELLFYEHRGSCATCDANGDCKLQRYAYDYQISEDVIKAAETAQPKENYSTGSEAIEYDSNKCIRCGRCVRICEEVQMANALTFKGRASNVEVSTAFDIALIDSTCVICGQCISACPTGALYEKYSKGKGQTKELKKVRTTCPYCGVGCQMDLNVNTTTKKIVRVTSEKSCVPNDGNLCVKGRFGFHYVHSDKRLTKPLIKENGQFREAEWDEAIALVGKRLKEIRDKYGPDSIAFLSSCRCTNEENYLMQKIARTAGGTNNIDQCATTCHAPTVAGLASSFGSGAMTNSIDEVKDVQTFFIIGSNPTEAHPIIGLEMKKALAKGAKLVVCDPRKTWVAKHADVHIQHKPGTDNMLTNAMMNYIIENDFHAKEFVANRCEDFEQFRENLKDYTIEKAAKECGVDADLIRKAAEMYAKGTPSSIFYTLGITEHTCGTENVQNLANLAMLCGQIGKPSSGVNPLRGQNNVQGGCDMGAIYSVLPGYQKVADPVVREKFEKAWDIKFPTNIGGRVTDFIEQAGDGILRGFYCLGEDPVLSEPNQAKVIESLKKLEFIICQEIFMSETAKLADVVLPATSWAEKNGTFTNSERRVQRIRKAVDAPGQAKPDWQITCLISTAMGYPMSYNNASEVFDEMASLTPSYGGISFDRIDKIGLQWPCPDPDHPGTGYLHKDKFVRGKGLFHKIKFRHPAETTDEDYPLILSTGRTLYNYNIGNMTQKSKPIRQKQSRNFIEMHFSDAEKLGVKKGDKVNVRTRRGDITVEAVIGDKVRPGALWMPFHFIDQPTNKLTNDAFDNITRTAEYKVCAAAVKKA